MTIPKRNLVDVLTAIDSSGTSAFRLQIQGSSGAYQIRAFARSKRGREASTGWTNLSDAAHTITVDRTAASSTGGSDGNFSLSIDGSVAATSSGLSNGSYRVIKVRVGPQSVGSFVSGLPYFDNYVTLRSN